MTHGLSKSRLIAWRQCPKRLWLQLNRPELLQVSAEQEQRFQVGFEVGEVARRLFSDGILIEEDDLQAALAATRAALVEHPDKPLFEATFGRDGVLVRADVMLPEQEGHRMIEVKASTGVRTYHLADCAVQAWVVAPTLPDARMELAHVNREFVYPGDGQYQGLLECVPVTDDIAPLVGEVPDWVAGARNTLAGPEPEISPGPQCNDPFPCPFQSHCNIGTRMTSYPIAILPWLSAPSREQLSALAIEDVRDVPADFPLTDRQALVRAVTRNGRPWLSADAAGTLVSLPYPRYFLDFETVSMAVPIWPGTRPYQTIPVQWSCHIERVPGDTAQVSFLASGSDDPRRAFAEALIGALGAEGPVFVYNRGFEGRILRELAEDRPDLAAGLDAIADRMVDLLPITREHYYHPGMLGSWSIKAVLPTIAPELAYDALDIGDGGSAEAAWREILHPDTPAARRGELRAALARYCTLDTWAMVRLAWFLAGSPPARTEAPADAATL